MNGSDIVECGWKSPFNDCGHTWFPIGDKLGSPDNVFNSTVWEAWDCLLFKLRNGQIIRVKKKEGK